MKRPFVTLFILASADGKISSGDTDELDPDRDWKLIPGVREGLPQYYELERETDLYSLNSGRVMAKIGVNSRSAPLAKSPVTFIVLDNRPHLTKAGVEYIANWGAKVIVATTNKAHPARDMHSEFVQVVQLAEPLNLTELFTRLQTNFGIERLTVQSGGELNSALLRAGLIDRVSLVLAPLLVGGRTTPTIMDGESVHSVADLHALRPMRLIKCRELRESYIHLVYDVVTSENTSRE